MDDAIRIHVIDPATGAAAPLAEAVTVIVVPAEAPGDAGRIVLATASATATAKHDLRALAQMALFDVEEGALTPEPVPRGCMVRIGTGGDARTLDRGLVIVRDVRGAPRVLAVGDDDARKLLAAAYRYTTRWVRLDVR
jgi:hypothetical protein